MAEISLTTNLQEIAQELSKTRMQVMVDLKRDYHKACHILKAIGATTLTPGTDRLPYFAEPLRPTLRTTTIFAKAAGDAATYNVDVGTTTVELNFLPDCLLNFNDHTDVVIDRPYTLTIAPADIALLEELSFVVKVSVPRRGPARPAMATCRFALL